MITCTSELAERELLRGANLHYRTIRQRWILLLSGIILLAIFGRNVWLNPSQSENYPFLILGIYGVTYAYWRNLFFKRAIRQMPNVGKKITWVLDETALRGKGDAFEFSMNWSTVFSATITKLGFLVYPQKRVYYWMPCSGFATQEDLSRASDLIVKNVKRTRIVQLPVLLEKGPAH